MSSQVISCVCICIMYVDLCTASVCVLDLAVKYQHHVRTESHVHLEFPLTIRTCMNMVKQECSLLWVMCLQS